MRAPQSLELGVLGNCAYSALVDPRVASSVEVITGALPAQYGFRTAGIVNMKTRTDGFDFDGDAGIYAGSNNTFQPSMTLRDTVGRLSFFVSGSYLRNDMGISNPLPDRSAIHDRTEQWRGFGYLSYVLNDNSRIRPSAALRSATSRSPTRRAWPPATSSTAEVPSIPR